MRRIVHWVISALAGAVLAWLAYNYWTTDGTGMQTRTYILFGLVFAYILFRQFGSTLVHEIITDEDGTIVRDEWSRIWRVDLLWLLALGVPAAITLGLLILGIWTLASELYLFLYKGDVDEWPSRLYQTALITLLQVITYFAGKFTRKLYKERTIWVRQDQKADRQFLAGNTYFTNTPVLKIGQFAFFSGGQQKIQSDKQATDDFAMTSMIMQLPPPPLKENATPDEMKTWKDSPEVLNIPRHEQFIILEIVFTLGIWTLPKLLSEKFFTEFNRRWQDRDIKDDKNRYNAMKTVRAQILDIVLGNADGVFQDFSMQELNANVDRANRELTDMLRPLLQRIGVELEQVIIVRVLDMPNVTGFQTTMQKGLQAKQQANLAVKRSKQDARERIADAEQNLRATEKEMETRRKAAEFQETAIAAEVKVAEQVALRNLQPLIQELTVLKDQENRSALLSAKLSELGSTQMEAILVQFAKSLGLNVEHGGNITFTSVAGDPVRFHPGMAASEIIKTLGDMFNLYMKGENPKP